MATIYRGWISGAQKDAEVLTSIGIKFGEWNSSTESWMNCEASSEAMEKLDGLWGQFIWGLESVEV